MTAETPPKRKRNRTGIGVLLLIFGVTGLITLFRPSPGMLRPSNEDQFVGMLFFPLAMALAGAMLLASAFRKP